MFAAAKPGPPCHVPWYIIIFDLSDAHLPVCWAQACPSALPASSPPLPPHPPPRACCATCGPPSRQSAGALGSGSPAPAPGALARPQVRCPVCGMLTPTLT